MFNLHTHTFRCNHAVGDDRAYVEAAIQAGYTELGFSDHAPMLFPADSGHVSHFRMLPRDFEGYVESVSALKREYASDIRIYLGAEMEYYPALFEESLSFYCQYPIDYLIQGQHFLGNEYDHGSTYASSETEDDNILRRYIKQTLEGLNTGAFTYLAHPDLVNFKGNKEVYRYEMEKLCEGAKKLGIPLEVNMLGFIENRCYPNRAFWTVVRRVGNDVVLGIDAHDPVLLANTDARAKLERWSKKMKLSVMTERPVLRDPRSALKK